MSVLLYLDGALEPVTLAEPFNATFTNLAASLNTGAAFFLAKAPDGNPVALSIAKVTHFVEVDDE